MIKTKIVSFKHGLFWYAVCEIPYEEYETLVTLHCIGLTYDQVNKKMLDKLKLHFKERKNDEE